MLAKNRVLRGAFTSPRLRGALLREHAFVVVGVVLQSLTSTRLRAYVPPWSVLHSPTIVRLFDTVNRGELGGSSLL